MSRHKDGGPAAWGFSLAKSVALGSFYLCDVSFTVDNEEERRDERSDRSHGGGSKETAWCVKPCKYEDSELNPQNPWKTKPTNWI